jgi:hypothetical protein
MSITMSKCHALLIFERFFRNELNRLEVPEDFLDEMDNLDFKGDFYEIGKESGKYSEGDIFLLKILDDEIAVTDLYYYKASYAANMSYTFNRIVELHVFDDADIERLSTASNFSDYLKIKKEIVRPQHHLVFDKGDLTFFGEIYDIHGFL